MKRFGYFFILLFIASILVSGCGITDRFFKSGTSNVASTSINCAYCQAEIDVTGLEKGCEVKCPDCNALCTY